MPYIPPEVVEKAREMDLLTYLKSYEPQELVHFGGNTYCTREHDSLKISNGKWCWFSRGIGGYSALDYLIKVKEMPFTQAVETIMGNIAVSPPAYTPAPSKPKEKVLLLPKVNRCATHAVEYLHGRGIDYAEYTRNLRQYIADKKALILRDEDMAIGAIAFSPDTGSIDFLAIHPQYRNLGITKLFLDKLADGLLYGKEISLTTYRAGDKADTGYREEYYRLGFAERELLVEYGYPTQRFVLLPKNKEEADNDRNTSESVI